MDTGEFDGGFVENFFEKLPEGFVANALALTSPRDVCRLSLVCSVFRSAAEWDAVWEKFLPPNYQKILAEAEGGGGGGFVWSGSKKELYLRLCDHPVIIDGGNKSFSLDKRTGKKCYMMAARDLSIIWGNTPRYWRWNYVPDSRFAEVAELISVCWLEVRGRLSASMLSTDTCYVAYLVYKSISGAYGLEYHPAEVSVGISGDDCEPKKAFLDPQSWHNFRHNQGSAMRRMGGIFGLRRPVGNNPRVDGPFNVPKQRQDGWLEIELGEYLNKEGEGVVEMSVMEVKGGNWKGGLIIQGIEIRPKAC